MASGRSLRLKDQLLASWKWILSFRTNDWELHDYPVVVRKQDVDPDSPFKATRFTQHRYVARIVNWLVTGGGNTPEEATENLRQNFESTRRRRLLEDKPPVRPGIKVPIEFASQVKVGENGELSEDFIQRVLGLDWAWISDESSLSDFHTDENNELLYSKILDVYDVDVSDIESAKLYEIFERIKHAQKAGL